MSLDEAELDRMAGNLNNVAINVLVDPSREEERKSFLSSALASKRHSWVSSVSRDSIPENKLANLSM